MRVANHRRDITASQSVSFWLNKGYAETTKKNYRRGIRPFFQWAETHPDQLIATWKKVKYDYRLCQQFIDEWTEKIEAYAYGLENYTPASQEQQICLIVSFFRAFKIPIQPDKPKHCYVKYHNRDLKREEIQQILANTVSLRDNLFFLMMAESGLRPYTLAQLKYEHIKEDFEANRVPMMIELPSELLKDRVSARWTFIGEDAFKVLKTYLKPRLPLKDKDLIFIPEREGNMKGDFLDPVTFTNKFSRIVLKLGITEHRDGKPKKVRLYNLRKWFNNNCRYDGFDSAYKEFWLGHETVQTHYISRDPERHREEHLKAYQNLRIYKPALSQQTVKEQQSRIEQLERELQEQRKIILRLATLKFTDTEQTTRELDKLIDDITKQLYPEHKTEEARIKEFYEKKAKKKA